MDLFMNKTKILNQYNSSWIYKTNRLIIENQLFDPNHKILVAVSGGQDSMLLLSLLFRLKQKWSWDLAIIHCNHKWNDCATYQARQIFRLCNIMNIPFYLGVPTEKVDTENKARNWRYSLITCIALTHQYHRIATGHTATDRIETLLYNFCRGTGFEGLQSLNWKRMLNKKLSISLNIKRDKSNDLLGYTYYVYAHLFYKSIKTNKNFHLKLVRPLLNITRKQIGYEISQWEIPVISDPTNQKLEIRRNRIRNQLLPFLRKYFNPKIDFVLNNLADVVHFDLLYLENIVDILYLQYNTQVYKNLPDIHIALIKPLPIGIQRRVLKKIFELYGETKLDFDHIEQIRLAILNTVSITNNIAKTNCNLIKQSSIEKCIDLPNKVQLIIKNNKIVIERKCINSITKQSTIQ